MIREPSEGGGRKKDVELLRDITRHACIASLHSHQEQAVGQEGV